ncbi:MAG: hypothetical protein V1754_12890 [Pseudomonadota bacterium]
MALLCIQSAKAAKHWYGIAAGPLVHLVPSDRIGVVAALSAGIEGTQWNENFFQGACGTLFGLITESSKALLPTLTGELGLEMGTASLLLNGGVELFGIAQRNEWTVFSTFGLVGSAGVSIEVSPGVRLSLRGQVIWLPPFSAARLAEPPSGEMPTFAFASALFGVEFLGRGDDF